MLFEVYCIPTPAVMVNFGFALLYVVYIVSVLDMLSFSCHALVLFSRCYDFVDAKISQMLRALRYDTIIT